MQNCTAKLSEFKIIDYDDGVGRRMLVRQKMDAMTTLFTEKPYSVHFFDSTTETYCANCLKHIISVEDAEDQSQLAVEGKHAFYYTHFVACRGCTDRIYCNIDCREEDWARSHSKECETRISALEKEVGVSYLALRNILIAGGFSKALEIQHEYQAKGVDLESINIFDNDPAMKYPMVLAMQTQACHHGQQLHAVFAITAIFFYRVCQKYHLVPQSPNLNSPEIVEFIRLLEHHLMQLSTNLVTIFKSSHAASAEDDHLGGDLMISPIMIGSALYPVLGLLNHSCKPNTLSIFNGTAVSLRLMSKVYVGEELSFSYGPLALKANYFERTKFLSEQYYFQCDCISCARRESPPDDAFACVKCHGPSYQISSEKMKKFKFSKYENAETSESEEKTESSGICISCTKCFKTIDTDRSIKIIEKVEEAKKKLELGNQLMNQGVKEENDVLLSESYEVLWSADEVICHNLYTLNSLVIRSKRTMSQICMRCGWYRLAVEHTRRLANIFEEYRMVSFLWYRNYRFEEASERVRIIKLLIVEFEEKESKINPKEEISEECEKIKKAVQFDPSEDAQKFRDTCMELLEKAKKLEQI